MRYVEQNAQFLLDERAEILKMVQDRNNKNNENDNDNDNNDDDNSEL
jgi:hypothetical protein